MKYLFLFLLLISLGYSNLLESINYNDAIAQAQEDDKIIMIMYGEDNSYALDMVDNEIFEDIDLVDFINENFHYTYINITHNKQLRGLRARGTPTFYFLDKNKKLLNKFVGAVKAKAMRKLLDDVLFKKNKEQIDVTQKLF